MFVTAAGVMLDIDEILHFSFVDQKGDYLPLPKGRR
jgi:hypothetical protein